MAGGMAGGYESAVVRAAFSGTGDNGSVREKRRDVLLDNGREYTVLQALAMTGVRWFMDDMEV